MDSNIKDSTLGLLHYYSASMHLEHVWINKYSSMQHDDKPAEFQNNFEFFKFFIFAIKLKLQYGLRKTLDDQLI